MGGLTFPLSLPSGRPYDVVGLGGNAVDRIIRLPRTPTPGEKLRVAEWSAQGGGRAATAMVTMARLGLRTRFLGGVGDDPEGRESLEYLTTEGIDTSAVRVTPGGMTQRAFILVDAANGERTILWGRGDEIMLTKDQIEPSDIASGMIFYTDAQEPHAACHAARSAKKHNMPVIVDLETPRPGIEELLPEIDILIASTDFPRQATGKESLEESIPILEERTGGGLIIVTLGPSGAAAWIDKRIERFPAFRIDAVDTTGAGDVFHGAFVTACVLGCQLQDALDFSNAVAALKCLHPGGRLGIPRSLEEIERFRKTTPHAGSDGP